MSRSQMVPLLGCTSVSHGVRPPTRGRGSPFLASINALDPSNRNSRNLDQFLAKVSIRVFTINEGFLETRLASLADFFSEDRTPNEILVVLFAPLCILASTLTTDFS